MRTKRYQIIFWACLLIIPFCLAGCEPGTAAPLPSPLTPDDTRLVVSSLTDKDDTAAESPVAVVGLSGAVDGEGTVRVTNTRTEVHDVVNSTSQGTFVSSIQALAGDTLSLVFIVDESESTPVTLEISSYTPPSKGVGVPDPEAPPDPRMGGQSSESPKQPTANDTDGDADTSAMATAEHFNTDDEGAYTFKSADDFIQPGHILFIVNLNKGTTVTATANESGAVEIVIVADSGDELLLFSQSTNDPNQTSPATIFTVP
jgi:hypothetical protein